MFAKHVNEARINWLYTSTNIRLKIYLKNKLYKINEINWIDWNVNNKSYNGKKGLQNLKFDILSRDCI